MSWWRSAFNEVNDWSHRLAQKSNDLIGFLQLEWSKHNPGHKPLAHKPTPKNLQKSEWERWLIPNYMYSKKYFPKYLSGSGYLVTHKASKCLLEKSKVKYKFQTLVDTKVLVYTISMIRIFPDHTNCSLGRCLYNWTMCRVL